MTTDQELQIQFERKGFVIVDKLFTSAEVDKMLNIMATVSTDKPAFRKSNDLFAIRQFLQEVPAITGLLFSSRLCNRIKALFGRNHFVVKSIYFDKPPASNWFVPYHQDLTIAVNEKAVVAGFSKWTIKQNQFAVQPPVAVLQNNFTIRIHLDDTDANNGALTVMPGTHVNGIVRPETLDVAAGNAEICRVNRGGVMIMRPLLLHASGKTTNNSRRRVIHIEFSDCSLPSPLRWTEYYQPPYPD